MAKTNIGSNDQQIRDLIAEQHRAICRKDVSAIVSHYSEDAVVFNVKPPYQIRGRRDWRRVWETSLSHFPASFGAETRDVTIVAAGDLATVHFFFRFTGLPGSQPWIRNTVAYQKQRGEWKIVHEHSSVPFDPETSKAVFEFE